MRRKKTPLRIDSLRLRNFRVFKDVEVSFGPLNVLIGANGSGKTTLLEVFEFLAVGVSGNLKNAVLSRGGIFGLRAFGCGPADPLLIEVSAGDYEYAVELKQMGLGYIVDRERLTFGGKVLLERNAARAKYLKGNVLTTAKPAEGFDEAELLLAQAPRWNLKELDEFRALLWGLAEFTNFYAGPGSPVRLPQILEPGPTLTAMDGSKLVPALYNIKSKHEGSYTRIIEALRAAFHEFRDLDFPMVSPGTAVLNWKEEGGREFDHYRLSEGTLRFLCLTTLLLSPDLPPLLVMDEPETSMHPEMLMILAGMLREASRRSLIVVATHSERLIRWLKPEEVLICEKEDGVSGFNRADDPALNLKEWLDKYTLDQLWLMGELGGRP